MYSYGPSGWGLIFICVLLLCLGAFLWWVFKVAIWPLIKSVMTYLVATFF